MAGLERGCGGGKKRSFISFKKTPKILKKSTKFDYFRLEIRDHTCPARGVRYHQAARQEVFCSYLDGGTNVSALRSSRKNFISGQARKHDSPLDGCSSKPQQATNQVRFKSTFPFVRLRVEREASIMDLLWTYFVPMNHSGVGKPNQGILPGFRETFQRPPLLQKSSAPLGPSWDASSSSLAPAVIRSSAQNTR